MQILGRREENVASLVQETANFVFHGSTTDLLHPDVNPMLSFPGSVAIPVAELPEAERSVVVAGILMQSTVKVLLESLGGFFEVTSVSNPRAYLDLLKVGEKAYKQKEAGHRVTGELAGEELRPNIIAGVVYEQVMAKTGRRDDKEFVRTTYQALRRSQPKLEAGETMETRRESNKLAREQKRYRYSTIRTLAVGVAATGFAISSLVAAHKADAKNDSTIRDLTTDRTELIEQLTPAQKKILDIFLKDGSKASALIDIDSTTLTKAQLAAQKAQIIDNKLSNLEQESEGAQGNAEFYGAVGLGALLRLGFLRLTKPPKKSSS